jgi:hypothetical protein
LAYQQSSNLPSPSRLEELVKSLSASLGQAKARQLVEEAVESAGFESHALTRDQALQVLEVIAQTSGIVGVVARFVKSRLILSR